MNAIDPGFEELLAFVRDSRAFDYTGYRRPTLMRRFQKRMQEVGSSTWAEYREFLARIREHLLAPARDRHGGAAARELCRGLLAEARTPAREQHGGALEHARREDL